MLGSSRRVILLLGDSITEQAFGNSRAPGWASILSDAYRRKADVLNRGFSGYTTRLLMPVAARIFSALDADGVRPALTTLFLGANDANQDAGRTPSQAVPLSEFEARLTHLAVEAATRSDALILIAPGPVDDRRWTTRSNAAVATYSDAVARVATTVRARLGDAAPPIACVSLFELAGAPCVERSSLERDAAAPWLDLLSDGLHLSPSGNALLAAALLDTIATAAPRVSPSSLALDYPLWLNIEHGPGAEAEAALDERALAGFRDTEARTPTAYYVPPPQWAAPARV
jgi:lysophospholipase L1-like esterase